MQSDYYLLREEYFEAYGFLKIQHKLGPRIHFATMLPKYYVALMEVDRVDDAERVCGELAELLQEKFAKSTDEICRYAERLVKADQHLKAFLFFQIVWKFEKLKQNPVTFNHYASVCFNGVKFCALGILSDEFSKKHLIRNCLFSWMRNVLDDLGKIKSEVACETLAACLLTLGTTHGSLSEGELAESAFKNALDVIKKNFGREIEKHYLYGVLLCKLGYTYFMLLDKPREAVKFFSKAIPALKKAENFKSQKEQRFILQKCEDDLRAARQKIKP